MNEVQRQTAAQHVRAYREVAEMYARAGNPTTADQYEKLAADIEERLKEGREVKTHHWRWLAVQVSIQWQVDSRDAETLDRCEAAGSLAPTPEGGHRIQAAISLRQWWYSLLRTGELHGEEYRRLSHWLTEYEIDPG